MTILGFRFPTIIDDSPMYYRIDQPHDVEDVTGSTFPIRFMPVLQYLSRTAICSQAGWHPPVTSTIPPSLLAPGVVASGRLFVALGLEPAGHLQANLLGGEHRRQIFHLNKLQHRLVFKLMLGTACADVLRPKLPQQHLNTCRVRSSTSGSKDVSIRVFVFCWQQRLHDLAGSRVSRLLPRPLLSHARVLRYS